MRLNLSGDLIMTNSESFAVDRLMPDGFEYDAFIWEAEVRGRGSVYRMTQENGIILPPATDPPGDDAVYAGRVVSFRLDPTIRLGDGEYTFDVRITSLDNDIVQQIAADRLIVMRGGFDDK